MTRTARTSANPTPDVCVEATPDDWEDADLAVLKVGGVAEHPTLGNVTVLQLGPLGATIEFFSNVSNSVKARRVLTSDLTPLPEVPDAADLPNLARENRYRPSEKKYGKRPNAESRQEPKKSVAGFCRFPPQERG